MFLFVATAAAAAVITVFNAAVGNGDNAPREPDNNNGNNRNRVMNDVFSVRDRVINDTLGPRDWERQGAHDSVKEDWDAPFRRLLPLVMRRSLEHDPDDEFDDIKNKTTILATAATLGGGEPADLDRNRVRCWHHIFRLRSLEKRALPLCSVPCSLMMRQNAKKKRNAKSSTLLGTVMMNPKTVKMMTMKNKQESCCCVSSSRTSHSAVLPTFRIAIFCMMCLLHIMGVC